MDHSLFRWINNLTTRASWANGCVTFYAQAAGIPLLAVLLLVAYFDARRRDDHMALAGVVWAGGAALVALGIGQVIGNAINRSRPYEALTGAHVLVNRTADFSFPSDHATVAGAVAAGLLLANRRWGIVASVLAILLAFARVYVGAHFPGDVAAGLALGAITAWAGHYVAVPVLRRIVDRLAATPIRRFVTAAPIPSL